MRGALKRWPRRATSDRTLRTTRPAATSQTALASTGTTTWLLRRAAVNAADRQGPGGGPLSVTADDLDSALEDLLDSRNQMTRSVLGFADD